MPPAKLDSAFPTQVLKDFLFLGSYDNASRSEVLKTLNITHILNTMPDCHNLYRNLFAYHCLQDDKTLDFDGATQFLRMVHIMLSAFWSGIEQCVREKSRVLVHCMSGKNRSAAVVTAFLMKSRGWRVAQCFQWVKDRRPQVLLTEASQGLLVKYEQKLFGPNASILAQTVVLTESFPSLGFGFPEPSGDIQVPAFSQSHVPSIFERAGPNNVPSNFSFGEGIMEVNPSNSGTVTSTSCDNQMDSS